MASLRLLLLGCMLASASAFRNRFIFTGFGRFLCDQYGGPNNICIPDSSTDREVRGHRPDNCQEICTTCPEEDIQSDLNNLLNMDPATNTSGSAVDVYGEVFAKTDLCDVVQGWTTVKLDPVLVECQLQYLRWRFSSRCKSNSPGHEDVRFAILRLQNGKMAEDCLFTVIAEIELNRVDIDQLLAPATTGIVQYNLTDIEKSIARALPGDYFGFRWTGSGVAEYKSGTIPDKNSCLKQTTKWKAGEDIDVTTTSGGRLARLYSMEYGCLPY